MPSLPGKSRWLCGLRFSEKWWEYRYLCLNLVSFWRENRDNSFTKVYLSLDLGAEPCNNYAVQTGRVWGCGSLAEVRLQEGESLENALRRFKRKVQQEDIIKEVKRHSFYLKPGEKKRVKEALARKRSRKKARKEQD